MPLITAANAREMAARSHAARKLRPNNGEIARTFAPQRPQISDDPLAFELTRAIEETLAELRACKVAKDRASLAQALRNLRETYHLVTGEARPGIRKGGKRDQRSTAKPAPLPDDTQDMASPRPGNG